MSYDLSLRPLHVMEFLRKSPSKERAIDLIIVLANKVIKLTTCERIHSLHKQLTAFLSGETKWDRELLIQAVFLREEKFARLKEECDKLDELKGESELKLPRVDNKRTQAEIDDLVARILEKVAGASETHYGPFWNEGRFWFLIEIAILLVLTLDKSIDIHEVVASLYQSYTKP